MYTRRSLLLVATISLMAGILACDIPTPPPATLPPLPPTVTPHLPATEPPTSAPPTEPPTEPSTEPPPSGWLPPGTIALYTVGTWESPRLHALAADGSTTDLGRDVHSRAAVSRSGRWIAYPSGPSAGSLSIVNLENGTTYAPPVTPGFTIYGQDFDIAETRLAFMELGADASGYVWAIGVVNLSDGSTTRFDTTLAMGGFDPSTLLPGNPIGWAAPGNELLLNTFMPDTEGNWGGVWGITLPPGTPSASLDTLGRRQLVSVGDYLADPRLSPEGARLLYLNRDFGYTPAGYTPMAYDLAVNELWSVDIASAAPTLLVNAVDGSALARGAAWSPDGAQTLFAQGNYAGDTFASLTLKRRDGSGTVHDAGAAPLPPGGGLRTLDWCAPNVALVTVTTAAYDHQLHTVDMTSGGAVITAFGDYVSVLGCIQ